MIYKVLLNSPALMGFKAVARPVSIVVVHVHHVNHAMTVFSIKVKHSLTVAVHALPAE
jgi:hypothetical protein